MAASRNRPSTDLAVRVGDFLAARLAPDERLCLGLSGGCDSVVLLHLLSRLALADRLSAIHIHHGLSPQADRWAVFCADLCGRLAIPCQIHRVDIDRQSPLGLEAAAREARYRCYAASDAHVLLLAQHRDDQAETLLFNLLRGCGVSGAAAMPVERMFAGKRLLRPLLGIARAELEAYAVREGLRWVEDESNTDTRHARNFIRHDVLPVMSARFPGASASLAQAASNFGEADILLNELAAADWAQVSDGESASLGELRKLSVARLKNLLRFRLHQLGWRAPAAARLDEFARQLQSAGPDRHPALNLPDGTMRAGRGRLRWQAPG